jgi:hypothetical protein
MDKCEACHDFGKSFVRHHLDGRANGPETMVLCPGCHVLLHKTAEVLLHRADIVNIRLAVRFACGQFWGGEARYDWNAENIGTVAAQRRKP